MPTYAKYHNTKVEYEGCQFDSQAEARRYQELRVLEEQGVIDHLQLQPRFILQEGFRDRNRKWQRPIVYIADFSYYDAADRQVPRTLIVEDAKGVQTQVFRLKAKMFRAKYPDYDLRIVRDC